MSVKICDKQKIRMRKKKHIKKRIFGTPNRPRLCVFRSLKQMNVQLIDDTSHHTIASLSTLSKEIKEEIQGKTKTEVAKIVGLNIAKKAKSLNYDKVIFDRAGYIYHGRVKALAEGAREGGLIF